MLHAVVGKVAAGGEVEVLRMGAQINISSPKEGK